ncbi:MAG TPA: ATP-binding protein [Candidatus Binatia bacterium]|nr:ATP-binding protein [Candidatus Binatia bacterium]
MIKFASSLRGRLIGLVLLALLPAFGVILFTDQRHRASIASQVQKSALGSARVIATEQRRIFENAHQLLITLARLPQIREQNSVACEKILAGLLEPLYVDLGVFDSKGNLLCNASGSRAYKRRHLKNSFIHRVVETQDLSVGEVQRDASNGKTVIELGFPVSDSPGILRGIAFVVLDYSWIVRITAASHLPSEASFTLFDDRGRVFLRYPEEAKLVGTRLHTGISADAKVVQGVEGNIESLGVDRVARLFTYRQLDHRIAGNVYYAGIDIPARAAFSESERILRQNLLALSGLAALTVIAAWFGADLFVLRRVRDLMNATRELASGNLKARTGLPYGESELGHLSRTFDDLAQALEQRAADARVAEMKIQKQQLRQSAIHEISAAMTSSLDVGNVLRALLDGVATLFPSSYVTLSWVGEQSGMIETIGQSTRNGATDNQVGGHSERSLAKEVFRLKSPLLIPNLQLDSRASDLDSLRASGFVAYLGLPMIVNDEVLGVLSFYSTEVIDLRTEEEVFLTDITQQAAIALHNSRLYEQTKNQASALEKSNRIKDEFLGVISHELRTPLNIIMNCSEALKKGVFGEITPEHEKGTEKIRTQASHLLSLINGILEITKIETGGASLNLEPVDLNVLSTELESDYAMVSKEKNLAVSWHVPANLPGVMCDRMKLRQVIINLVNNAIKFTDQGSVDIFFRSVADEPFFEVSVADTGIGMAEEFLPHIFDKFRQIDNSTTRNYSGTGLGLYLVKGFLDLVGGTISVKSKVGEGTIFTARIPVRTAVSIGEDHGMLRKPPNGIDVSQARNEGEL